MSALLAMAATLGSAHAAKPHYDWSRDWSHSRFERVHSKSGCWNTRQVTVREGTGPPNITFDVEWKPNGSAYAISTFTCDNPSTLMYTFRFNGKPTRFTDLRAYDVVPNDLWTEGDHMVKQFPSNVFVGKAIEANRPTTYVWAAWEKGEDGSEFKPVQLLKVYGSDTRHLDGLEHGKKGEGDYLIEHVRATWIPNSEWPAGATRKSRLRRKWHYVLGGLSGKNHFAPDDWRIEKS